MIVLVPLLVTIVKLGVHLPTVLRGIIFYIQISPIAVEFLPQSFKLKVDAVSNVLICLSTVHEIDQSIDVVCRECTGSLHAI